MTSPQIMQISKLLENGYKIFLDKQCTHEYIRHTFYYQENQHGCFIYHFRNSYKTDKVSFKDYPTIEVSIKDKDRILHNVINEIIDYVDNKNYTISYDSTL